MNSSRLRENIARDDLIVYLKASSCSDSSLSVSAGAFALSTRFIQLDRQIRLG